jgi:zinc protease
MQINRSNRPPGEPRIDFTSPKIKKFDLTNGLKIYFSNKTDLPIVRINLLVNGGSKSDPETQKGLCNLLAMCLDEGAGQYNSLQLADEFEILGAQFAISCTDDLIILSLQVLTENFLPALKLLSDVVTQPHLMEDDFNREKNKVLVRINQSKAEPDYIADIAFVYFLFGNDSEYAFPVEGIERTAQNIQFNSVKNSYSNLFTPLNSTLVTVGNLDEEFFREQLDTIFGKWNHTSLINNRKTNLNKTTRKIYLINKPDSFQTEIRTGHLSSKRSEDDFFQKQIINLILGGQFSSRLNSNLREKNGFTYGIHSQFNYLQEAGYFAVSTSVDAANTSAALREIYSEINKIKSGVTQEELDFAKSSLTKKYPSNFETFRQIASAISTKVIHNLPDNYFETYIEKVSSLNLNDINSIAYKSICPDEIISVLVGDSTKILSQLDKNEFGEIEVLSFDEIF